MALKCGIVGLPNVGKSTLFNALTNGNAEASNYRFCTINKNDGVVAVPDPRLTVLAELVKTEKIVPTYVDIVDIAGLVRDAHKNVGLGNMFLSHIRECEAILHVLRCFDNDDIEHVEQSVNPVRDREIVDIELQLKDIQTVTTKLESAKKNAKGGNKDALREADFYDRLLKHLDTGKNARDFELANDEETQWLKNAFLLTAKKVLYVLNVDEGSLHTGNKHVEAVKAMLVPENASYLLVSAAIEAQIIKMDDPKDRQEFYDAMGITEPGLNALIRAAYQLLGLQTYFTAGVKEVRAWTIPIGAKAPEAAGVIHSDFERGFIRAEVIKYKDFVHYKTEAACRDAGKLAIQGKDYVVEDGDIMHFRFNV